MEQRLFCITVLIDGQLISHVAVYRCDADMNRIAMEAAGERPATADGSLVQWFMKFRERLEDAGGIGVDVPQTHILPAIQISDVN